MNVQDNHQSCVHSSELKEMEAMQSHSVLSFLSNLSKAKVLGNPWIPRVKIKGKMYIVSLGMLAPRKFMQRRKKVEVFKDAADEAEQKKWRRLMREIDEAGSAVLILRSQRTKGQALPRDLVLGTLQRFKQLKKWNLVSEVSALVGIQRGGLPYANYSLRKTR